MYRVIGPAGEIYIAADLAVLQQWIQEGRVVPSTTIEVVSTGQRMQASMVPGVRFGFGQPGFQQPGYSQPGFQQPGFSQQPSYYPRQPMMGAGTPVQVPWVKSILSTICCCVPLGIVSIVYASQASTHNSHGDYIAAQQAAKNSDTWSNVSIALGLIFCTLELLAMFAGRGM